MKQRYQIITIYEEDHGCEVFQRGKNRWIKCCCEQKPAKSIGQELRMLFC